VGAQRLSGAPLARAVVTDLGRSLARVATRRTRTSARVADEYDEGAWRRVHDEAAWTEAPTLEAFLVGRDATAFVARMHDAVWSMPKDEYYRWRIEAIQAIARDHAPADGALLELGSGFGMNLFSLSLDPRWRRLRGLDVSKTGIDVGAAVARWLGLDHVTFGEVDLTDPGHPGFAEVEGATVLTYFCLEQLPAAVERVVEAILDRKPRRVIHVESAAGMLRWSRPFDVLNKAYVASMDYQTTLVDVVESMTETGRINLLHRERLTFGPSIHNDPCLLVWEPA
jgi:hypothetical protein